MSAPGTRERERQGASDPAARPAHGRDATVEPEAVEDGYRGAHSAPPGNANRSSDERRISAE